MTSPVRPLDGPWPPGLDPAVQRALASPTPSAKLRAAARLHRGARRTVAQIHDHHRHWAACAIDALAGEGPLLIALGDSLAQGIGASDPSLAYPQRLADGLATAGGSGWGVVNFSRSGAKISDVVEIQVPAVAALGRTPGVIVCTVGSNDLMGSARPWRVAGQLVDLAEALGSTAVVATLPAAGSLTARAVNRRLRRRAEECGVSLADVGARLDGWRGRQAGDGFHPNDRGYEVWYEAFAVSLGIG